MSKTAPGHRVPDQEWMSAAGLVVVIQWLGLDQRALARILGVDERTVRRWVSGQFPVPDGARVQVEAIESAAAAEVEQLVAALREARDPRVLVYRSSKAMWADRPELEPYPAGWWRMVCARAAHQVPGVGFGWADG